jgi:diguanylate cyclase (GGDEF)-like protein
VAIGSAPSDLASKRGSLLSAFRRTRPEPKGEEPRPLLVPIPPAGGSSSVYATLSDLLQDDLTGLGSLLSLRRDLEPILDQYQPFGTRPALFLLDVDRFGQINAAYGRPVGDRVLQALADRLRTYLPAGDAAYRTGGDEFVALLCTTPMIEAVAAAGHLQEALTRPVAVEEAGLQLSVSVSVAVVMLGQRHRVDELLRDADVTMYRAKSEGGSRVDVYNWEVDSWSTTRKRDLERLKNEVEQLRLQNHVLTEALTLDLATGMPNGLAFEADHQQVDAWRRRSEEPYSILRVSIDGAATGGPEFRTRDALASITAIAHAVRDTIRQSDRAYVMGNGDFTVLLRGSVLKQAVAASGRIRASVERLAAPHPGAPGRHLTVTVAAIQAGYLHATAAEVVEEVNALLRKAVSDGGARIAWPH